MGELIDRTLAVFKNNWKDYAVPAAIYSVPMMILFVLSFILGLLNKKNTDPAVIILNLTASLAGWLLFIMLSATVITKTQAVVEGRPFTYRDAFSYLFRHMLPYGATIFLNTLAVMGIALVLALIAAPPWIFIAGKPPVFVALAALLTLAALILMVYLVSMLTLVPNTAIIENNFYLGAIRRSVELFNTSRDARLKVMLLPGLVQFLVVVLSALIPIAGYFFSLLLSPLPIIALTLVYYDIRINAEGLDMEMEIGRLAKKLEGEGGISAPGS
jgi:hypothetical protein